MFIQNRKGIFSFGLKFWAPLIRIMFHYLVIKSCMQYKKDAPESKVFTSSQPDLL